MKKYLLSMSAILLAVVLFAFTQPVKKANQVDMYVFQFDPTASGGYAEDAVENISNANWKYQGKNYELCGGQDQKACRVAVRGDYVNNTTTPTALQSISIEATLSDGTAHVTSISGTGSQYSNQLD